MICKYCGTEIDEGTAMCPYCGNDLTEGAAENYEGYAGGAENYEGYTGDAENYGGYEGAAQEEYADEDFSDVGKSGFSGSKLKMPSLPGLSLSTVLAAAAALFSFLALLMVCLFNRNMNDRINILDASVNQVQMSLSEVQNRLSTLDSTVANVQQDAYNQLANTTITITKDITSLTGPVTQGKFNQMFIIKAKGNLDLATSFKWQKLNSITNNWEDIQFTGNATSNEQYGLRIENVMDGGEYKTILWANGITPEAAGSYRCVIEDVNGIKKTSLEAAVSVA